MENWPTKKKDKEGEENKEKGTFSIINRIRDLKKRREKRKSVRKYKEERFKTGTRSNPEEGEHGPFSHH